MLFHIFKRSYGPYGLLVSLLDTQVSTNVVKFNESTGEFVVTFSSQGKASPLGSFGVRLSFPSE